MTIPAPIPGPTDRPASKWEQTLERNPGHSQWYIERFRAMEAEGRDLAGEARMLDALLPRHARVLDAGCGPGRLAAELAARGHTVVAVDVDPALIAAAEADHPGPTYLVADISFLDLPAQSIPQPFDGILVAGNVMTFLADGTEPLALARLAAHLVPGGVMAVGFGAGRGYGFEQFFTDAGSAGLTVESRFSTWDLRPFDDESTFLVAVLRKAATPKAPASKSSSLLSPKSWPAPPNR